jgi:hypothetical protein
VQVPELLSPGYQSHVIEASCWYRNHDVTYEPGVTHARTANRGHSLVLMEAYRSLWAKLLPPSTRAFFVGLAGFEPATS